MITVFTIGYGNRSINSFIKLLDENNIAALIDVRSFPYSRFNPNYNKSALQLNLHSSGIEYLYMGDVLGGKPKDENIYNNGILNYELVNDNQLYKSAINELIDLADNKRVCLMCCELNPDSCHRKALIGETLVKQNIAVKHINQHGLVLSHNNFSDLRLF